MPAGTRRKSPDSSARARGMITAPVTAFVGFRRHATWRPRCRDYLQLQAIHVRRDTGLEHGTRGFEAEQSFGPAFAREARAGYDIDGLVPDRVTRAWARTGSSVCTTQTNCSRLPAMQAGPFQEARSGRRKEARQKYRAVHPWTEGHHEIYDSPPAVPECCMTFRVAGTRVGSSLKEQLDHRVTLIVGRPHQRRLSGPVWGIRISSGPKQPPDTIDIVRDRSRDERVFHLALARMSDPPAHGAPPRAYEVAFHALLLSACGNAQRQSDEDDHAP